jgi:tryptophanyl-tRNA synthetase
VAQDGPECECDRHGVGGALIEVLEAFLTPIRERRAELAAKPKLVD